MTKEFSTDSVKIKDMMDSAEMSRAKSRIVSSISGIAAKTLNYITGAQDTRITKSNTSELTGDRVFSGVVRVTCSVTDCGDRKEIEVPFSVKSSVIKKPDVYIIKKKLAAIEPTNSRHLQSEDRMSNVIASMKEREDAMVKEEDDINKGSKIFEKEAKVIEVAKGAGGINTTDGQMVKHLEYEKISLPSDVESGDEIVIGAKRWKVSEGVGDYGQEKSNKWILDLIEGK